MSRLLPRRRLFGDAVIPVVVVMALDHTRVIAVPVADRRLMSFDFVYIGFLSLFFLLHARASYD